MLLSIGTPPQKVFAQLDTGSFELWVNPNCSGLAAADRRFCNAIGRYDPANSSTSVVSDLGTSLRYGIGAANITYVLDDITLGDDATSPSATMRRVQFGVATTSEDQFAGILGIGFGRGINIGYNNFVDELARQNVTRTKAFSVALGSKDESQGVIVFGGVDSSKFSGRLARLPIIPADKSPDGVARYWVSMKGLTHVAANGTSTGLIPSSSSSRGGSGGSSGNSSSKDGDNGMPVFLDTGATLTLLPPAVAGGIASAMGATEMDLNGFHIVDCALAGRNGSVDFAFEGVTVRVPYSELIREVRAQPPTCYLGVMPSETFALLGDTFLRSAYVVFDLDGNATYMAQYNNCGTTVRTIVPSSDLKSLVGECNKGALDVNGGANDGTRSGNKPNGSSKLGSGAVGPDSLALVLAEGDVGFLQQVVEHPAADVVARDEVADGLSLDAAGALDVHADVLVGLLAVDEQARAHNDEALAALEEAPLGDALVLVRGVQGVVVEGDEEQGHVAAVLGDAGGADDGEQRPPRGRSATVTVTVTVVAALGAHGGEGVEQGGDAALADVRVVHGHGEARHADGAADGEVDGVDEARRVVRVGEAGRDGGDVVGVAGAHRQVGGAVGELGLELGGRAAEGDACVAGGDGAAQRGEAAAASGADEGDGLGHFCGGGGGTFLHYSCQATDS
ncbi:secreted aspartic proteinase [Purpureocillium lavendulum]|uniref:Secreted aspartic proteinase n=1 Tax=Purpureocillium lavendulum TaxID=1247861 RepID=A0AB34FLS8_9HYPO|nr:secreted aspartic proteinase [Purpureocillium lavendulum]